MNPFVERYKKLTNEQLIDIIMQPDDYQELALQTAEEILSERGVTDEEKNTYIQQINEIKEKEAQKKVKPTPIIIEQEILDTNSDLLDSFKKVNTLKEQDEHIILAICIIYGSAGIFQLFLFAKNVFKGISYSNGLFTNFIYIAILILPLVCFYLLWQKKKLGWQGTLVYFVFNIIGTFFAFTLSLNFNLNINASSLFSFSSIKYLLLNCFGSFFGFLFLIKPHIYNHYEIDEGEEKKMILIGAAIFIVMNFATFAYKIL